MTEDIGIDEYLMYKEDLIELEHYNSFKMPVQGSNYQLPYFRKIPTFDMDSTSSESTVEREERIE